MDKNYLERCLSGGSLLVVLLSAQALASTDQGVGVSAQDVSPARPYALTEERTPCANFAPQRQAFFGDLHVHTALSFDAATQDTRNRPSDAYRFAQGEPMGIQPYDKDGKASRVIQIDRPLDFAAVTDHSEFLGEVTMCRTPGKKGYWHPACVVTRHRPSLSFLLFGVKGLINKERWGFCGENNENCLAEGDTVWQEVIEAAENAYDRSESCSFTSFVGYEWTATVGAAGSNLHRNVIFRNANVPSHAASWLDTPSAVDLWDSLEENCIEGVAGCDAITIPHNSNISSGLMFQNALLQDENGLTETASREQMLRRARWEPLAEMMQHKGSSECDSRTFWIEDEFCDFEKFTYNSFGGKPTGPGGNPTLATEFLANVLGLEQAEEVAPGPDNFLRYAVKEGLRLQAEEGANPFKYGFISSTDTHIAAPGLTQEQDHPGHGGAGKGAREEIVGLSDDIENGPGGHTVLWAEENTRDALFAAMQRREAYATTGTRPILRLFAGWDLPENLCEDPDMASKGYQLGVPMGGDVPVQPNSESQLNVLVAASMDPGTEKYPGAPLQRIQLVKGWYEDGELYEKVFDVAGGPNSAGVDLNTCERTGEGHQNLCTVWTDDEFSAEQQAFYYARVLENPTCRWSQYECLAANVDCSDPQSVAPDLQLCCSSEHKPVIQERAWSSPVWYKAKQIF